MCTNSYLYTILLTVLVAVFAAASFAESIVFWSNLSCVKNSLTNPCNKNGYMYMQLTLNEPYLDLIKESEQNCDLQPLDFGLYAEVGCIEVGLGSVLIHNNL